ncbi:hypothetical protein, partial [Aeromonas media]|uniref:hypothetical protein n=1 Tax=Aeromonas media TaxID=651 RepID=UPI003CFEC0B4
LTALTAEFTVGEGKLMTHDEPCSMAPDDKHDLISGTCSHLPKTWCLLRHHNKAIAQRVQLINHELQSDFLIYKPGFVDYWK